MIIRSMYIEVGETGRHRLSQESRPNHALFGSGTYHVTVFEKLFDFHKIMQRTVTHSLSDEAKATSTLDATSRTLILTCPLTGLSSLVTRLPTRILAPP